MRIGIDIRELSAMQNIKGGWYQYVYNLLSNLLTIDSENEYILLSSLWHGAGFRGDDRIPRKLVRRFPGRFTELLLGKFSVRIETLLGNLDVFHGPCGYVPSVRRCKSIVTIHDVIPLTHPEFMPAEAGRALVHKLKASAERADAIITDSGFAKTEIVELLNVPEEKVTVIYIGAAPILRPLQDQIEIDRVSKRYGISGAYFLFVGNIEPRKNLETLIRAAAQVRRSTGRRCSLVIAGHKDWCFDTLAAVVRELNAENWIIFPGVVDGEDLPSLYSGAELFVFPSLAEGFGIPIIEAMACGTPVVASNRTSIPEIAGDAALLVDPTDTNALAGAIQSVLCDPMVRQALVERGLDRSRHFSWERTASETLDLYRKIGLR